MSTTYRVTGLLSLVFTKSASPPTITTIPVPYANGVTPNPSSTTITFEGDDSKFSYVSLDALKFDVKADEVDWAVLQLLHQTAVTTSLPSDESSRIYVGSSSDGATPVGIQAVLKAKDAVTGAAVKLRVEAFVCNIDQMGKSIDDIKTKAKSGATFTLETIKTTKDIGGVALPGVPTDGVYYSVALLT